MRKHRLAAKSNPKTTGQARVLDDPPEVDGLAWAHQSRFVVRVALECYRLGRVSLFRPAWTFMAWCCTPKKQMPLRRLRPSVCGQPGRAALAGPAE